MSEKTAVITGATGGIGQAVAQAFDALGYRLVLVGRSTDKLDRLNRNLKDNHMTMRGNLSLIEENLRISQKIKDSFREVHLLLNIAGVISQERKLTTEGNELTLATNLLGPIALTQSLMPNRAVMTGSGATMFAKDLSVEELQFTKKYNGFQAYARTKAYLTLWGFNQQTSRKIVIADPDATNTEMARDPAVPFLMRVIHPLVMHKPEVAANAFTKAGHSLTLDQMTNKIIVPKTEKNPSAKLLDKNAALKLLGVLAPLIPNT